MSKRRLRWFLLFAVGILLVGNLAGAESNPHADIYQSVEEVSEKDHGGGHNYDQTLLWMIIILATAKMAGIVKKIGQPPVLGEIFIGVILGNLVLLNIGYFEPMKADQHIAFLAELGVIFVLFQAGLESNLREMKDVGIGAVLVAIIGVVLPFVLGFYVFGPWLLPEQSNTAHLFLAAALTATSVGITTQVFKDLKRDKTREAKTVLGAAVFDDIIGLIILSVVSTIGEHGSVTRMFVAMTILKAVAFIGLSIVIGYYSAPHVGKMFSKIRRDRGTKLTMALVINFIGAVTANYIGLHYIVGAFAAGLVLDPVHFDLFKRPKSSDDLDMVREDIDKIDIDLTAFPHLEPVLNGLKERTLAISHAHAHRHIEDLIEPLVYFLAPMFFVLTGAKVDISMLFDLRVLGVAAIISIAAIVGKFVAGFAAGKGVDKTIVGLGMVPRGEVGLIFAAIGAGPKIGAVTPKLYSVIVTMVIITTFLPPLLLPYFWKRHDRKLLEPAVAT